MGWGPKFYNAALPNVQAFRKALIFQNWTSVSVRKLVETFCVTQSVRRNGQKTPKSWSSENCNFFSKSNFGMRSSTKYFHTAKIKPYTKFQEAGASGVGRNFPRGGAPEARKIFRIFLQFDPSKDLFLCQIWAIFTQNLCSGGGRCFQAPRPPT